ncbi:MAG: hypothetical protein K0R31_457 [Clostridiales bacterium]|jgi:tetratricopeptide (TPR) repeat protein|nr:hypothetical protein [Clostridiales bacterium]
MRKKGNNNVIPFRDDSEFYFRIGIRYADHQKYDRALKYLSKAAEAEPYNADYLFNLAGVLAELKQVEKSNETLLDILKNIDPTLTECYFGIGCNYFDMENFKKAREYFEKYVYFEPEGAFSDEVYDVLYYLQIYEDVGTDSKTNKIITRLANEGKRLLGKGEYRKACEKLEKAIEIDPEVISPRNDLSLAYFLLGDENKSYSIAKSVLKLDPEDIFANCNIALFHASAGKKDACEKQLKSLSRLELNEKDEVLKLIDTYIRLREYRYFGDILRKYTGARAEVKAILQEASEEQSYSEEAREAMLAVLRKAPPKSKVRTDKITEPDIKSHDTTRKLTWDKSWEGIINCAVQRKEFDYKNSYKKELKEIWMNFISKSNPEKLPVISKEEVWAAALEYIYCKLHYIAISKKKLADKYKVSETEINNKIKNFNQ